MRASVGIAVSCGGGAGGGTVVTMAEMVEAGIDGMTGGMVVTAVVATVVGTTVAEEAQNRTWSLILDCWGVCCCEGSRNG